MIQIFTCTTKVVMKALPVFINSVSNVNTNVYINTLEKNVRLGSVLSTLLTKIVLQKDGALSRSTKKT